MDFSPLDDFFEFGFVPQFPCQSNQLCFNGLPELDNLTFEEDLDLPPLDENFGVRHKLDNLNFDAFNLPPLDENNGIEYKPLNMVVPQPPPPHGFGEHALVTCVKEEVMENNEEMLLLPNINSNSSSNKKKKKKRSRGLEFEEIKKYFGIPITKAAKKKKMNVGLALLKRRCWELNIMRWPHRKLKSLKLHIDNVKGMGLSNEVALLEQHIKMLEQLPWMEVTDDTKNPRQACFKANQKKSC